ncbi:hypothetical protein BLNAU_3940 [Blattamonas nauphoetae]|uniref:Uncharacterized protein n=1 Tax=Blattamonas nauphoetae TaxID=2049346 RepID=A0ABQ9YBN6_9EUKA|nr:hypothetical protein BLNAU_3940 [Blattamonas nauphoetae]
MVPPSPPTPVSKLMPQLFLGNEDTTSSIAVRFLLAVILLVRKFLNTQRITHVVICGTGTTSGSNVRNPSTFLASPAKHVSRVCSFLDKALDGDGVILLVSGACDGSDVAEPADSDEAIESFTLHKTSFKQAVRLAPCVVKPKSSSLTKPPQTSEPTRGTGPTGSILRLGDARRHRTPLKLAKTSALLSRVARPLTSACRSYTPLGLGVPQINVRNVPVQFLGHPTILELMEAGNRNCQLFGQSNKTPSDGKDRPGTAPKSSAEPLHSPSTSLDRNTPSPKTSAKSDSTTPERHARPPTLTQVSSAASLDSLASSSRIDSPMCATSEESESVIELNPTPLSLRTD